jgi:Dolichyl-phosphate-mannose-protein mannosyltransferase
LGTASPFRMLQDRTRLVTLFGIGCFVIVSLIYLELGQANADEGWYLYASKLVFQGELPYRDFAYTQMPLLPYVYGVIQVIDPSIFWGRLTSILLSIGTLALSIVIARRYGGERAAGIAALLFAFFTFCVYYNSIVKTYALVSFFFAATVFVLSSQLNDDTKYPLALLFAFAATFARLTALFFLAPVLVYALAAPRNETRALILLESAMALFLAGVFLVPDWQLARWDLLDSHLSHWGTSPIIDRLKDILTVRLPDIVQHYGPVLVLGALALYFIVRYRNARLGSRDLAPVLVTTVGLVLFGASHLVNGIWEVEYLVPAFTAFLPIVAIALSYFYEAGSASQPLIVVALIAVLLLLPLDESTQHTDLTGGRLPLEEIDQVAAFVAQNSQPTDQVLALEALNVVVDANRSSLPGMTLAQFSLQEVDTATAERLHVVNYDLLANAIEQKTARVIVLTDGDWNMLAAENPAGLGALQNAVEQNYREAQTMTEFGQFSQTVHVYLRR